MKPILEIQTLLREHGLAKVKEDLVLEVKEDGDLVLLKYNQIAADWTKTALYDCRGIILDKSNNWEIVAYPYKKFFNLGEGYAAKINWNTAKVLNKEDGSLITLYYYKNKWNVATSGRIYADTKANSNEYTFAELFWNTITKQYGSCDNFILNLDINYNYMFELCTPWNIVVTQHQTSKVLLHGIRNMTTLLEEDISNINLDQVKQYNLYNTNEILNTFDNMSWQEEGYVVVDTNFNRIKIKNPAYVSVHHVKSGVSPYEIISVIKNNEIDEFCTYFAERTEFIKDLEYAFKHLETDLTFKWYNHLSQGQFETQKEFALIVLEEIEKPFHGLMFNMKKGSISNIRDGICQLDNKFLYNYFKHLLIKANIPNERLIHFI